MRMYAMDNFKVNVSFLSLMKNPGRIKNLSSSEERKINTLYCSDFEGKERKLSRAYDTRNRQRS